MKQQFINFDGLKELFSLTWSQLWIISEYIREQKSSAEILDTLIYDYLTKSQLTALLICLSNEFDINFDDDKLLSDLDKYKGE